MIDCSIILINYYSIALLRDCLQSVFAQQSGKYRYEIIVADNSPEDGAQAILQTEFPSIRWINLGYNAGFARANNAAMQEAQGRYLLILNSDTIILDQAIDTCIAALDQRPDAIGAGLQLLWPDGRPQISGAHFARGGINLWLPFPYLGDWMRAVGRAMGTRPPSVDQVPEVVEVDWLVGAYMLIRKEELAQVGMFDPDFFMYAEEIEWCARLRQAGKLLLFGGPRIIHIGGATSGSFYQTGENENSKNLWNKKGRQIMLSNLVRIRKQFGLGWWLLHMLVFTAEIVLFGLGLGVESLGRSPRYTWSDWRGFIRNVSTLWAYSWHMLLNKPYFYRIPAS